MNNKYKHLSFSKRWNISPNEWFLLGHIQGIVQAICHVPILPGYRNEMLQVSLRKGAQATTAIEGNTLSDEEIKLVAKGESLPKSQEYQEIEIHNILIAMNELVNEVAIEAQDRPISPETIRRFHKMIGKNLGTHLDAIPGRFREDSRVVGGYLGPDHQEVPELVARLCKWLKREFRYTSGTQPLHDAIIQAIITHVYIEWIHPFGDGNGRTGRLLEFYILLCAGMPDIASHILSNHYNNTRPEYYRQLQKASQNNDLSEFIRYALQGLLDGLNHVLEMVQSAQFIAAWTSYVNEILNQQKITKRPVLRRRRNLILSMQIGQEYEISQLHLITPQTAQDYARVTPRALKRDVDFLINECNLIHKVNGKLTTAAHLLLSEIPRRKRMV
ncbi:Fic family protein [bacterium]|nr:Fic family protein [bacterium]